MSRRIYTSVELDEMFQETDTPFIRVDNVEHGVVVGLLDGVFNDGYFEIILEDETTLKLHIDDCKIFSLED